MGQKERSWGLFTDDTEFTFAVLRKKHEEQRISNSQAAHWALSIGERAWVEDMIDNIMLGNNKQEDESIKRGLIFRMNRGQSVNPYTDLIKLENEESKIILDKSNHNWIALNGGIGDHIEDISILHKWKTDKGQKLKIITTPQRKKQFEGLILESEWTSSFEGINYVNSKTIFAAMKDRLPGPTSFLSNINNEKSLSKDGITCCWTARGCGDELSGWIRSVSFKEVYGFYKELAEIYGGLGKITDISNWKEWEKTILRNIGIKIVNPEIGTIKDIARLVVSNKDIITIDTSLVHLCAALGKESHLLLPKYCDERWYQLLKGDSSYKAFCRVYKQKEYGKWFKELRNLKYELQKGIS